MSGIKGRSGRKPRHEEEKKILKKLYPLAVSKVREILQSQVASEGTLLEAAKVVIYQVDGKPHISIDQRVTGYIGLITADGLAERIKLRRAEETHLIAQYSVEVPQLNEAKLVAKDAVQRGIGAEGGINAIQGQEEEDTATEREEIEAPE